MAELLKTPITVVHVFVCLMLVLTILIQPGKSGGLGAALGGAGAQQVFGGRGAGTFLSRATWIFAVIFFCSSVVLAYFSSSVGDSLQDLATSQAAAAEDTLKAEETRAKQDAESAAKTAPSAEPAPAPGEEIVIDPTEAAEGEPGSAEGAAEGEPAAPAGEGDPAATAKEKPAATGLAEEAAKMVAPKAAAPKAAGPKVPAPMAPKPSVPAPMAPMPAAPQPMMPAPQSPAPMAPKPAAPKPVAPATPSAPATPGQ